MEAWITEHDLQHALGGRIFAKNRFNLLADRAEHQQQLSRESVCDIIQAKILCGIKRRQEQRTRCWRLALAAALPDHRRNPPPNQLKALVRQWLKIASIPWRNLSRLRGSGSVNQSPDG